VLLETFWVLRLVYDFDDTAIARAIEGALGLPRVQVEDSERVKLALAAVADRIDIADALHVATTPGDARAFATCPERHRSTSPLRMQRAASPICRYGRTTPRNANAVQPSPWHISSVSGPAIDLAFLS